MIRNDRYKLATYHNVDYGELYDLHRDPNEFTNLWDDPAHSEIKLSLIRQSFDHTVICGDPGPAKTGRY
jgi:hypothetical protein